LGSSAIGWDNDIDHSFIAHAGVRDGAIYLGSILLKYVFTKGRENEELRKEVLDNDEFKHIQGLDHGTAEKYDARRQKVAGTVAPRKKSSQL